MSAVGLELSEDGFQPRVFLTNIEMRRNLSKIETQVSNFTGVLVDVGHRPPDEAHEAHGDKAKSVRRGILPFPRCHRRRQTLSYWLNCNGLIF